MIAEVKSHEDKNERQIKMTAVGRAQISFTKLQSKIDAARRANQKSIKRTSELISRESNYYRPFVLDGRLIWQGGRIRGAKNPARYRSVEPG